MSASGLLTSRVVPSYSGPPRRYYRITPLGRGGARVVAGTLDGHPQLRRRHRRPIQYAGEFSMSGAAPRNVEQYLDSPARSLCAALTPRWSRTRSTTRRSTCAPRLAWRSPPATARPDVLARIVTTLRRARGSGRCLPRERGQGAAALRTPRPAPRATALRPVLRRLPLIRAHICRCCISPLA